MNFILGSLQNLFKRRASCKIRFIKKHLITLLYVAVSPVPDGVSYRQINTCSSEDIALNLLNTKYLDKFPMKGDALKDENLKQIAQQMADGAGLRRESIEENKISY